MRILVSNDDGIDAPGLTRLAQAARTLTDDIWIVAPERKWTAASHQLTFDRDLALRPLGDRRFGCSGAPADCIVGALRVLMADRYPDLVLAGLNDKRNVGEDLAYSGTLALAREAALFTVPAIAWSSDADDVDLGLLSRLLAAAWDVRDAWASDGHWLAIVLPRGTPAGFRTASLARDKIANDCDVVERAPAGVVFRLRRGRPGSRVDGDENAVLAAGCAVVARYRLAGVAPVPARLLAALREATPPPTD